MKKILSLLFSLLIFVNVSASATYRPFEVADAICVGKGVISLSGAPEDGEMSLAADDGETFEEVILAGWDCFAEEIDIEKFEITVEEFLNSEMYSKVSYANPLYYYIGNEYSYNYMEYEDGEKLVSYIYPTYTTTDRDEVMETWEAIEEETNNILLYINEDMTEFEKVMAVHDYMVLHYDYDHTLENHSITIMITKTGVCESYTNAFNHVMEVIGIESVFVASKAMLHAWNLVKVDGKWYHVDVTWDDTERPDQVDHQFELLSDERIQSMENPHYGYDTGGRVADSDRFDDADWHSNHSQIVSVNGVDYWEKDNDLVDSLGNIIYENLDGDDGGWSIGGAYFPGEIYAGLAEFSGMIYFNTDKAIYSYNPETGETKLIKEEEGICGLYIDKNIIRYCKYNREENKLYEADHITLNGVRYAIPYIKDDMIHLEIFNGGQESVTVFTFGNNGCESFKVGEGVNAFEFEAEEDKFMFIWDSNLRPLKNKIKLPE